MCNQSCPEAYICNISREAWDLEVDFDHEVDFLSADKHKTYLQVDIITLEVRIQACPKEPKQQLYNIFAISQGEREV